MAQGIANKNTHVCKPTLIDPPSISNHDPPQAADLITCPHTLHSLRTSQMLEDVPEVGQFSTPIYHQSGSLLHADMQALR